MTISTLHRMFRPRARWRTFREAVRDSLCPHDNIGFALRQAMLPEIPIPMTVTTRSGARLHLSRDPVDDKILRDIFAQPEAFFPVLKECSPSHRLILDVGGHHGIYAVEALLRYPRHSITILEPQPEWCRTIEMNLHANSLGARAAVVSACLAADGLGRTLSYSDRESWGATVFPVTSCQTQLRVNSITLQDSVGERVPDLIYCNAEGAEFALVPQLKKCETLPATLVLMLHPEYGDVGSIRESLLTLGYKEKEMTYYPPRPIFHYSRC